jgi:hypothetical protein
MVRLSLITVLALVASGACAFWYGASQWRTATGRLHARLNDARTRIVPPTYHSSELSAVPAPVQRYFRAVLTEGQPMVAAARFSHSGTFNLSEAGADWRRFSSSQVATTRRQGFVWDARIAMAPAVRVFVHDAYIKGAGLLHAKVMGLVTVADRRDTVDVARGELLRYFAEALWYPTALLPSQGVAWSALDDSSARATLSDGAMTVSLDFHFNAEGLIDSFSTGRRPRTVNDGVVDGPWGGRMWGYELREGMRIPLDGEVSWLDPGGAHPYWKGHITEIEYEFSGRPR